MAKYKEWLEPEKLKLLEKMGRDRATDIMIAGEIGINVTTLWRWENQYPEIAQALERGREVTDYIVENALFRKAIDGDVKAQIFWLRNRCPEKWGNRRKPEEDPEKPGLVEAICQAWERHEHTE